MYSLFMTYGLNVLLGPIVGKAVSDNPGLKLERILDFSCKKAYISRLTF